MKRSRRFLGIAVFFAMIVGLFPAGLTLAQVPGDADTVDTNAIVNPAGTPPDVLYKWELPDMQSDVAGIQFGTATDAHQHDDDMTQTGMQVAPNLEDLPELRLIDYWWVVTDPNGIGDLASNPFIRVFHPDGSLKYQLHGTLVPCSEILASLEAGVHTGQIIQADADLIVEECGKNVLRVFHVVGDLSKHQPCGIYSVEAQALDQAGNIDPTPLTNNFEVLCVIGFVKDFDAVDFGEILPNTTKWVRGDKLMDTPLRPSVKNTGNTAMFLWLEFDPMLGLDLAKVIDVFDGQLNTQAIDPIPALTSVCFDGQPFGSNEIKQLDLSIHPGSIPADTYAGSLYVWGRTSCTANGA